MRKIKAYKIFIDEKSDSVPLRVPDARKLFDHDSTPISEEKPLVFLSLFTKVKYCMRSHLSRLVPFWLLSLLLLGYL